jgi:2'-5' RNA ligase
MAQISSPKQLRLFIAALLPENIKAAIEKAQAQLRQVEMRDPPRWTRREQLHLTLKFLGNVDENRTAALEAALRNVCDTCAPLQMRAKGVGFFPEPRFPRVVWVGITDAGNQLESLWHGIQSATDGFTIEKAVKTFTGHVTLARIRHIRRNEAESLSGAAVSLKDTCLGEWVMSNIDLMRSELSSEGARHRSLASIPLSQAVTSN